MPSHLYSYSFERYDEWTQTYADQCEILDYLKACARKHALGPHLRFGVEIARLTFDSDIDAWRLATTAGEQYTAYVVVTATGQLNLPRFPALEGIDTFSGISFHSAQWNASSDLRGRRVAIIGNGCSAAQIVPRIAPLVERLDVFQRSPKWIIPRWNREFGRAARWLFRHCPWARKTLRGVYFLLAESIAYSPVRGGVFGRVLTALARFHLRRQIVDSELRARLTPNYPLGCNRMILSSDYYPALARDNVELIAVGIKRIVPEGIETTDGRIREVDVIIYATGFESTNLLAPIDIIGPGGRLSDVWREGASAYLGIIVPEFPNLFILYGPNTSSTSNSIVYMIESQVRYVIQCLRMIRDEGTMQVSSLAFAEYQEKIQARLRTTVWNANCRSWYKTEAGRIVNTWPLRATFYRRLTRRPKREDFFFSGPSAIRCE